MAQPIFDQHGHPIRRTAMIAVLLLGSFTAILTQTSLATALPTLMRSFGVTTGTGQWLTTSFLMANGIMIPVSAYLSVRIPTKRLYLGALAIFIAGTVVAMVTPTDAFWMILTGRVLQAIAVGLLMPLLQVIILALFDENSRGKAMGICGLVIGVAPAIGPTLSGFILEKQHDLLGFADNDSWRVIFGVLLPFAVIAFVGACFVFADILPNRRVRLNVRSLIESTLGFGTLLYGFAMVSDHGWTDVPNVVLPLVIGLAIIAEFIWHQSQMADPFLDFKVFLSRQFLVTSLLSSVSMMSMVAVEMILPLYMQNLLKLTPLHSGLILLPGALMMGLVSPISGYFYDRCGAKRLTFVGFTMLLVGTLPLTTLTATTPTLYVTVLYTLRMFGIAMMMMPLTASAMAHLSRRQVAQGTAANNTLRQICASLATATLISVMQNATDNTKPSAALEAKNPLQHGQEMVDAILHGFHAAFFVAAGLAVLGLVLTLFMANGKVAEKSDD